MRQSENSSSPILFKKEEKPTYTVGAPGSDIPGFSEKEIQRAADLLRETGGTIRLTAGIFSVFSPVRLFSGTTLTGAGEDTVLRKSPGARSEIVRDADFGELVISVAHPERFRVGEGIMLRDKIHAGGWEQTTARITAIDGNRLTVDEYLLCDYSAAEGGVVTSACSVVTATEAEDITLCDFTIDGNASQNDEISGCRGGAVYCFRCRNVTVRGLRVHHFAGEGISCQTMDGLMISDCEVYECTGDGVHPGTGSDRVRMEGCRIHHNARDGLFVCWRVIGGVFRSNLITENRGSGISIGHKDTDNLFENNRITSNGAHGIFFRPERGDNAPHRCVFRKNDLTQNALSPVGMSCEPEGLVFADNLGL